MEEELAELPRVWADDQDVLLDDCTDYPSLTDRFQTDFEPSPWGWSLAAKQRFRQFGVPERLLPPDELLGEWRKLSGRAFAVHYATALYQQIEADPLLRPQVVPLQMCYVTDLADLQDLTYPLILKAPWSSSGRSNFVVHQPSDLQNCDLQRTLQALLQRQGGIMADHFEDKVLDFAMEYDVDTRGTVRFLGYSVFSASPAGRYAFNWVDSAQALQARIADSLHLDADAVPVLERLRSLHQKELEKQLGGRYHGPVGIDMLVADNGEGMRRIHPCIELNLRMNMGIVAILLYESLVCRPQRFLARFLPDLALDRTAADLTSRILSLSRVPLTPMREHGFHTSLELGRLVTTFS